MVGPGVQAVARSARAPAGDAGDPHGAGYVAGRPWLMVAYSCAADPARERTAAGMGMHGVGRTVFVALR